MATRRLWWRHLLSVLLFPAMFTVFIPTALAVLGGVDPPDFDTTGGQLLAITGGLLIGVGLWLVTWTVFLFDRVGKGALLIGSPIKLVVRDPYQRMRNPMGLGVLSILLGTTVATSSLWLLGWFALLCTGVATLIVTVEEPYLHNRFGAEYEDYHQHVPRWIPRTSAWEPSRQR